MLLSGEHCVPRCLHVVSELGIADALGDTPQTAASLAEATRTNVDALGRVIRLLSAYGLFEMRDHLIGHTSASQLLRFNHSRSMRRFVRMMSLPMNWKAWEALEQSVRSGAAAADTVIPGGSWKYYTEHPAEARVFDEAIIAYSRALIPGILGAYDFSGFARVCDLGGGSGHLIRGILEASPGMAGILFDLPHVSQQAASVPCERLTFQGGDFFNDSLPVCDAYLIMGVLHDWSDQQAEQILTAVRRAAPDDAKVLVIETTVVDDPNPSWATILNIHMLAILAGKERSRSQYVELFTAAGLQFGREIETGVGVSILKSLPA
jgi:O-methyltransferase domain